MKILLWKRTLVAALCAAATDSAAQAQYPANGVCSPYPAPRSLGKTKHFPKPAWPSVPLGTSLDMHFQTMITNNVAKRMVLHDYDFLPDSAQLNYRGKDRLHQISNWLVNNNYPITIERVPSNPSLAEARRRIVVAELTTLVGAIGPDRVVIGASPHVPLQGVEAELIYQNLLQLTQSAGVSPATTGINGGASTGATPIGTGGTGTGGGNNSGNR